MQYNVFIISFFVNITRICLRTAVVNVNYWPQKGSSQMRENYMFANVTELITLYTRPLLKDVQWGHEI